MIWLASYPQSGSTYVCNILQHAYGLKCSVHFNLEEGVSPHNFFEFPAVQTHVLPKDLEAFHRNQPSAYIVRNGQAAIVEEALAYKNDRAPKVRLHYLILKAILADEESHHGGWSRNVIEWIKKADVIIRYEDLVKRPIQETEKLRQIMDLPEPRTDKLSLFDPRPAAEDPDPQKDASKRDNGRKKGMPRWMQPIFWRYHGHVMEFLGFQKSGDSASNFNIEQRKQKIHEIFREYPSRTLGEKLRLFLTKYGLL